MIGNRKNKVEAGIQIRTESIQKRTKGTGDLIDLTPEINALIKSSGLTEGSATVFNVGSTAGVSTIEYEPGLLKDWKEIWQKLIPEGPDYAHHQTWGDKNGFSHLRATLQGPSVVVPFKNGELLVGTWQQIVLAEFDDRPRDRKIVIQLLGQ